MTFSIWASSSAAVNSCPSALANGTVKNLFFLTKTTWLCFEASNFLAVSEGLVGYRDEWKLCDAVSIILVPRFANTLIRFRHLQPLVRVHRKRGTTNLFRLQLTTVYKRINQFPRIHNNQYTNTYLSTSPLNGNIDFNNAAARCAWLGFRLSSKWT